jgi:hypothetical protein
MCNHVWSEDEYSFHAFVACVATGNDCDPKSHGSITYREYCTKCKRVRRVNKNQSSKEYGEAI